MSRDTRTKPMKEMEGATLAPDISEPIVYIDNGSKITLDKWSKLDNQDSRRAFLDKTLTLLAKNFSSNWQQVYQAIKLMQESEWFWREKGYDSFEEFWTEDGKFSFDHFKTLEHAHLYATMVEPELFNVDAEKAIATAKMLAKVTPKLKNGRPPKLCQNKKSGHTFIGPTPEQMMDAGKVYNSIGSIGTNSYAYRFARMLRDAPHIAAKVKRGEYTKRQKNGKLKVDLEQAEKDAGLWKEKPKKQSVKRTAGERAVDALNAIGIAELRLLVERMGPRLKANLAKVLAE